MRSLEALSVGAVLLLEADNTEAPLLGLQPWVHYVPYTMETLERVIGALLADDALRMYA